MLLAFAEAYSQSDGSLATHRGIDIAARPGDGVTTPVGGTVAFVGRIPGSAGGTVLAVTVLDGDRRATFLPLDEAEVQVGQSVTAGATIGRAAAHGDPSSDASHVHVGLRQGDVYIDPAPLFSSSEPVDPVSPDPQASPAGDDVPAPTTSPAVSARIAESSVVPIEATAPSHGQLAEPATDLAPRVTVSGAVAAQRLPAGVTLAADAPAASRVQPVSMPAVSAGSSAAAAAAASNAFQAVRMLGREPLGVAGCLAAFVGCVALFTRRALARRIVSEEPMSDRLGIMLRALRAGDTLCGLTSCSGHSAFTDPGPS